MSIVVFILLEIYLFKNRKNNIKYLHKDDIDKYVDYIFEDILPDHYFDP